MIRPHRLKAAGFTLALTLSAATALAAELPTDLAPGAVATTEATTPDAPTSPSNPAPSPPAADDTQLSELSGRGPTNSVVALTEQDLTAISSGNTINAANVTSGVINLQDNALSGFSGVGNFMMNTGHNNTLQSSVSVTIIVTQ